MTQRVRIPVGRIQRIDARDVWLHEAHEFTPWLHANVDVLADALGFDIEATGMEVPVGAFAVDIVGKTTPDGRPVIVENQLASTDHGHLGQLLTYAAGLEAAVIVWLSPQFRDEHRQVLDWLNSHTIEGIDFFGVELELLRIDDSPAAPHFNVVAQPNEWAKSTREAGAVAVSERGRRYQQLFEQLLDDFKRARPGLTSTSRVGPDSWLGFTAGRPGMSFVWAITTRGRIRVELYIDTGDRDMNKTLFDVLQTRSAEIELLLGDALSWERLDNRKASRIATYHDLPATGTLHEDLELREWAGSTMVRWNDVLRPILKELRPII